MLSTCEGNDDDYTVPAQLWCQFLFLFVVIFLKKHRAMTLVHCQMQSDLIIFQFILMIYTSTDLH